MKRCPECKKTYTDETLNFYLDDGVWHVETEPSEPVAELLSIGPGEAPTKRLSPEGFESKTNAASRKNTPLFAAAGVIVLAVIALGGYWYYSPPAGKKITAVAVMPFANASGNPDVDYLSDGMTESLIGSLSRIPDLNVKSRSSVFRFKNKEFDGQTIGRELG